MCGEEDGRYDIVSSEWGIGTVVGGLCTKKQKPWVGWMSSDETENAVRSIMRRAKSGIDGVGIPQSVPCLTMRAMIYPVHIRTCLLQRTK